MITKTVTKSSKKETIDLGDILAMLMGEEKRKVNTK